MGPESQAGLAAAGREGPGTACLALPFSPAKKLHMSRSGSCARYCGLSGRPESGDNADSRRVRPRRI